MTCLKHLPHVLYASSQTPVYKMFQVLRDGKVLMDTAHPTSPIMCIQTGYMKATIASSLGEGGGLFMGVSAGVSCSA